MNNPRLQHSNSFDLIRLLAALAVLFSHAFALYGLPEPGALGLKLGTMAVVAFFGMSGYLVTQSWERDPRAGSFATKRGLRILPGLIVAVLFTALVAGALATRLPLVDYVRDPRTWQYIGANLLMGTERFNLPGVFEDLPLHAPNGSLWTLRYEVLMYAILMAVGLLAHRLRWGITACFLVCLVTACWVTAFDPGRIHVPLPWVWKIGLYFEVALLAKLGMSFFAGALLYLQRGTIGLSLPVAGLLLCMAWLVSAPWQSLITHLVVPYAALALAMRLPARHTSLRGIDVSYGVYVYAFPVQQLMSGYCLDRELGVWVAMAGAAAITLLLAAASWHLIEKPALGLKGRFTAPARPPR